MERLENTGDKKTGRDELRDGGIGDSGGDKKTSGGGGEMEGLEKAGDKKQVGVDERWRDWRTQGTKKRQDCGNMEI
jgi:hypothetical protein